MENNKKVFTQNIDIFWKTLTVYSLILIIYSILVGTVEKGELTYKFKDPIVILLLIIFIVSLGTLLSRLYRKKSIIIEGNNFSLISRFRKININKNDIQKIHFTREKIYKTRRQYSIVKIFVKNFPRPIRIRPSAFKNEEELVKEIQKLK